MATSKASVAGLLTAHLAGQQLQVTQHRTSQAAQCHASDQSSAATASAEQLHMLQLLMGYPPVQTPPLRPKQLP